VPSGQPPLSADLARRRNGGVVRCPGRDGAELAWFYFRDDPTVAPSAAVLLKEQARRRAVNFAGSLLDQGRSATAPRREHKAASLSCRTTIARRPRSRSAEPLAVAPRLLVNVGPGLRRPAPLARWMTARMRLHARATRAAAHAGGDEHHVSAGQVVADLVDHR
jgi:hypothetical protein